MADVAVFVSLGIKISDFDRFKFDSGREMELKKKETSAFHFYLRASEAGPLQQRRWKFAVLLSFSLHLAKHNQKARQCT
jgi:hypothetical protein